MKNIIEKYFPGKDSVLEYGNILACEIPEDEIIKICWRFYRQFELPLKNIFAVDDREVSGTFKIYYIFGIKGENVFLAPYISVKKEFPSITESINEAFLYERKIKTFFGLEPVGHPDPRPLILHENWPEDVYPMRKDFAWNERPADSNGNYEFQKVGGEGIYEIPVGPVHAGIIEPGHFRFSVLGEEIILLEPRLGYSHKGAEKLFEVLPFEKKIKLSERISGDSSFSHSLAFCQAIENLANISIPEKAKYLRVIFAELERLANHIGDIGAIMIDTGFNFGGANGARIRERIIQINERLSGSRFLRGVNKIGGVLKDIGEDEKKWLEEEIDSISKDLSEVIEIAKNSISLLDRLKTTGRLDLKTAKDFGVIGVAGKAIGLHNDARKDYPYAAYSSLLSGIASEKEGDVFARFNVRIKEIFSSFEIIKEALKKMPEKGEICLSSGLKLKENSISLGIVEGWRGDIVYVVMTDKNGEISRVSVRDPSFLNWPVLGVAGEGNIVPDFPLINKSFNLSYSGNDL